MNEKLRTVDDAFEMKAVFGAEQRWILFVVDLKLDVVNIVSEFVAFGLLPPGSAHNETNIFMITLNFRFYYSFRYYFSINFIIIALVTLLIILLTVTSLDTHTNSLASGIVPKKYPPGLRLSLAFLSILSACGSDSKL